MRFKKRMQYERKDDLPLIFAHDCAPVAECHGKGSQVHSDNSCISVCLPLVLCTRHHWPVCAHCIVYKRHQWPVVCTQHNWAVGPARHHWPMVYTWHGWIAAHTSCMLPPSGCNPAAMACAVLTASMDCIVHMRVGNRYAVAVRIETRKVVCAGHCVCSAVWPWQHKPLMPCKQLRPMMLTSLPSIVSPWRRTSALRS